MPAIIISNLSKQYKTKKKKTGFVLDNLSLKINKGEVFGFLGPNGAGKSTTIKILLDLIRATSGTVKLDGIRSTDAKARQTVGYLPEHPTFYDYLSAKEYLSFTGKMYGVQKEVLKERVASLLHKLKLWDVRNKPLRIYSKGMVQRLGIAQLLVHSPEIYILDEPMSGLDPVGRALIKEIILELKNAGKCVFLSSHIIADIEQICDRIGILVNGKLTAVAKIRDIMHKSITSYTVWLRLPDGTTQDQQVPKERLPGFLTSLENTSTEVRLIEPVRNDLEHFFLSQLQTIENG